MKKWMSLLLALIMMMTMGAAFADEIGDVAVTVNGEPISAVLVMQYAQYQVEAGNTETVDYEMTINDLIINLLANQKIKELSLDQYTDAEKDAFMLDAQAQWQAYIDEYVSYYLTEDTDEARAQAVKDAEAFYAAYGYSVDVLYDNMITSENFTRLQEYMISTQEITVTDEEVAETYQQAAQQDQQMFENNVYMYEMYQQYYGYESWYIPEGYRGVTHILLSADEALLSNYYSLLAQKEEEGSTITQADVDAAYQAVIASRQADIDAIYSRYANGEAFETLIAEYNTDPGMQNPDNLKNGYAVHKETAVLVPAFVEGAFSEKMTKVGDVSDPVISEYGIHIVYYLRDIPGGVVEMTEEIETICRNMLTAQKESKIINGLMDAWIAESDIVRNEEVIASLSAVNETTETEDAAEPEETVETAETETAE